MEQFVQAIGQGHPIAIGVGVGLLVILRFLVAKDDRALVRLPAYLLILYLVLVGSQYLVQGPNRPAINAALHVFAAFALLSSMARSLLLIVFQIIQRRRGRPVPKIFGDLIQAAVYIAIAMILLSARGVETGEILTTSALLTAVVALALQDTLGNMFSGLAIQAQRPFDHGDWIRFGEGEEGVGRVIEVNWRAIKVRTIDDIEITVPNGMLAKQAVVNYSKPTPNVRRSAWIQAPYATPPKRVQEVALAAALETPGVLAEPAPTVITYSFDESGITYEVRYYIGDFRDDVPIGGRVRDRLWYALKRANISFPFPHREVLMREVAVTEETDRQKRIQKRENVLACVDFLKAMPATYRREIAERTKLRLYAPDEIVIREGDEGEELFIVEHGEVAVLVKNGADKVEVARLGTGKFFGEMSLMTGERRKATVQAVGETELLVVDKASFQEILEKHPDLAGTISQVLAERESQLGDRISDIPEDERKRALQARKSVLLDRIRDFFSL
jgi:small-conductance mechanosensitive channel/CRP-like cAMP-binding protein